MFPKYQKLFAERLPATQAQELGENLFDCNRLQKKMQSLKHEIDNHEPWVEKICQNGREMIDEGHENSSEFQQKIDELMKVWQVITFFPFFFGFPFFFFLVIFAFFLITVFFHSLNFHFLYFRT